jgi:lysophospholipase L1-like esterase
VPEKKILFIGDSLIEYYDWQARFPHAAVHNLGVAGETVEELLQRVPRITESVPRADMLFIMTGINNVAMESFDFLSSYCKIIEGLSGAYPESRIFITSLLPVQLEWVPPEIIKKLNKFLEWLAENTGAEFMDLYSLFMASAGEHPLREFFLPDGVHLSEIGYAAWAGAVEEVI